MSAKDDQSKLRVAPPPWAAGTENRHHELNPELTEAQIDIVRGYGEEREVSDGTILWDIGHRQRGFFLVLSGALEIFRRDRDGEHVIITHGRGHYGGETATMSGRGAYVAGRVKGATRVIEATAEKLRELIATEAELGEIILLSFILRRMRMIAKQQGNITLMGSGAQCDMARIRAFLTRNGVPHHVVDLDTAPDRETRLRETDAALEDLPLLLCDGQPLKNPCNRQIAEQLGFAAELTEGAEFDVAVAGAGPAGLAAAVYAASEGLRVIVLEACAPGGQAGTSSRIENYLGFPTGISGQALAGRAYIQAQKFGAEIAVARELRKLKRGDVWHELELDGGTWLKARTVVIASGAVYRQPRIEGLDAFDGSGVHYGASYVESQFCRGKDIAIVGGGNSAGQAAVFLSAHARTVYILVRGEGLASSMSDYLIRRIDRIENIKLLPFTEVKRIEGETRMSALVGCDNRSGETRRLDVSHLFIFIGAVPGADFANQGAPCYYVSLTLNRRPARWRAANPRWFANSGPRESMCLEITSAGGYRTGGADPRSHRESQRSVARTP